MRKAPTLFDTPVTENKSRASGEAESTLSEKERAVYYAVKGKMTADELEAVLRFGDTGELLSILTMLEIYGLIEALPGGTYKKA